MSVTYAVTHMGDFLLLLLPSLEAQISVLRPKSQPKCQNLSQEAQIMALRPKTQPPG